MESTEIVIFKYWSFVFMHGEYQYTIVHKNNNGAYGVTLKCNCYLGTLFFYVGSEEVHRMHL